jgi:hypothetical protein
LDPQIYAQLAQTLLVANSTAVNSAGESTYGTATSCPGRVIGRATFVRNFKGEMVNSAKQIIFPSSIDVRINSKVYLPGETTAIDQGWVPVALGLRVGEAGSSDHTKVWLGGVAGDGTAG